MSTNQIVELEQNVTMKLQAKDQRLKDTSKEMINSTKTKHSKMMPKHFTDFINTKKIKVTNPPEQQAIETFWKDILENEINHNFEVNRC